ncbi:predicted protein [Nematostella vectensis]|uniref:Uncharacterized protein n=1 Tax=Nematostella vectensis TaxID=45351 RepID=A7RR12_NEMVE|nr:GRB10-interacting GYF protein 2 [Nematostella vectensis]EDO46086.1 predicted protein [Nematostella vectensis]|eukprot:XP_001638149.1 predicted protein [Nematostella vectensis]
MAAGNPLLTLERMLNGKTTLKTQKTTHKNIICIGTELLDELRRVMQEDKDQAIRDALNAAEAKAQEDRKQALEELRKKMNEEREQCLEQARIRAEEQMAEIRYRCEIAEKKRARLAWEKYMKEKSDALKEAAERAELEKQEALHNLTESLTRELRNEAALEREQAVGDALAIARKNFERRRKEVIAQTRQQCEEEAATEASRVARLHQQEVGALDQRIDDLKNMLASERAAAKKLAGVHLALKEDYKRFQNITRGYHSDYLLS